MRKNLNLKDFYGAICVMENYLEGAVADYENGDVENTYLIESCINAIKFIYVNTEPLLLYGSISEFENRMNNSKKRVV